MLSVKILIKQIAPDSVKNYLIREALHAGWDIKDQNMNKYKKTKRIA
jgi:hypothetical protein